jgi:uncharacterized membrane protein YqjE
MAIRDEQRTIGELFGQLTQDMSLLVRQEVALARVELGEKANRFRQDAMSVLTGGLVAYFGALALVAALVLFLDHVVGMAAWLAALLVGAALGITGYVMLQRSLRDMQKIDPTPRRTVATLKDDVEWAKEQRP